jgi:hypothetical protein
VQTKISGGSKGIKYKVVCEIFKILGCATPLSYMWLRHCSQTYSSIQKMIFFVECLSITICKVDETTINLATFFPSVCNNKKANQNLSKSIFHQALRCRSCYLLRLVTILRHRIIMCHIYIRKARKTLFPYK